MVVSVSNRDSHPVHVWYGFSHLETLLFWELPSSPEESLSLSTDGLLFGCIFSGIKSHEVQAPFKEGHHSALQTMDRFLFFTLPLSNPWPNVSSLLKFSITKFPVLNLQLFLLSHSHYVFPLPGLSLLSWVHSDVLHFYGCRVQLDPAGHQRLISGRGNKFSLT